MLQQLDLWQARVQNEDMPLEDHYTTSEAAEILGIKQISVLKLIEREKLSAKRVGTQYFIHKDEVARYKQERRKPGRPKTKRSYRRRGTG